MGIIFWIVVLSYPVGVLLLGLTYRLTGKGKRRYDALFFGIFRREKSKKLLEKKLEEQMQAQLKKLSPKKTFKVRRRFPDFSRKDI